MLGIYSVAGARHSGLLYPQIVRLSPPKDPFLFVLTVTYSQNCPPRRFFVPYIQFLSLIFSAKKNKKGEKNTLFSPFFANLLFK